MKSINPFTYNKWRKRVGIEPTSPDSLPKDIGFEVQGTHQDPSASD